MRKLELYADSNLKEFRLYKYVEEILRNGSAEVGEDLSIDELQSISLFKDFLALADILDNDGSWTSSMWTNFLTQMMIAFKEKGKASSINCALAALGIKTEREAVIEDVEVDGKVITKITLEITNLTTPNVDLFSQRLKALIPRLLWTHELNTEGIVVNEVDIRVTLIDIYYIDMFDRPVRVAIPKDPHYICVSQNWRV